MYKCFVDSGDHNKQKRALSETYFKQINQAYMSLKTKPQRQAYNRYLVNHMKRHSEFSAANNNIDYLPKNKRNRLSLIEAMKVMLWPIAPKQRGHNG